MVSFASFFLRVVLVSTTAMVWAGTGRGETVLFDFSTPGCGPCLEMRPVVAQLARQGHVVREIDASREPHLAREFGVELFPTFVAVVDGREFARIVGKTTDAQLAALLREAAGDRSLGKSSIASPRFSPQSASPPSQVTFASTLAPGNSLEPQPGRLVKLQDDGPSHRPQPGVRSLPEAPGTGMPGSPSGEERLIAATVRLRVQDREGTSIGTGTVIDSRQGRALVLTCGHIFRASAGQGPILATLFQMGPGGVKETDTVAGRVVHYDLTRDLGLVEIVPSGEVTTTGLADRNIGLVLGSQVVSVGCNHGALPTTVSSHLTGINRYGGTPNVEAAGAPVEGRSGGGLFNSNGELVGVCFAADPRGNEGLYASLEAICSQLDEQGLSFVYDASAASPEQLASASDAPQVAAHPEQQVLAAASGPSSGAPGRLLPFSTRGQSRDATPGSVGLFESAATPDAQSAASHPVAAGEVATTPARSQPAASSSGLSPTEQATLEELQRHGTRSEVICIIRPLTPDGTSDVIKIGNASPAFVEALSKQLQR